MITYKPIRTFLSWYKHKFGKPVDADLSSLSTSQRHKLILRWKHGLISDHANEDIEKTEYMILNTITPEYYQAMEDERKEYFAAKIAFEKTCNIYRRMLDLPIWNMPLMRLYDG